MHPSTSLPSPLSHLSRLLHEMKAVLNFPCAASMGHHPVHWDELQSAITCPAVWHFILRANQCRWEGVQVTQVGGFSSGSRNSAEAAAVQEVRVPLERKKLRSITLGIVHSPAGFTRSLLPQLLWGRSSVRLGKSREHFLARIFLETSAPFDVIDQSLPESLSSSCFPDQ